MTRPSKSLAAEFKADGLGETADGLEDADRLIAPALAQAGLGKRFSVTFPMTYELMAPQEGNRERQTNVWQRAKYRHHGRGGL